MRCNLLKYVSSLNVFRSCQILSTLQCFYLAMASYPEVQERAHAELDAIIGPQRLPTLADKPNLPYLRAVVKECLRWRPVAPLGFLHASVEENEYKGFRIPAGSAFVNIPWCDHPSYEMWRCVLTGSIRNHTQGVRTRSEAIPGP